MDDQNISPPWNFFSEEYLAKLLALLDPKTGYLAMNVLYYDEESKLKVHEAFKNHIKGKVDKMAMLEFEGWSNKVFVFSRDAMAKKDTWRANPSITGLIDNSKVLDNLLKNWKVANRSLWLKEMDMNEHIVSFVDLK